MSPAIADEVDNALMLLGASLTDGNVDTYLPPRILTEVRRLYERGVTLARRTRADAPWPTPAEIESTMMHIQRRVLNMSDPPPDRHVAYFTQQLRRALTEAYVAGWTAGGGT